MGKLWVHCRFIGWPEAGGDKEGFWATDSSCISARHGMTEIFKNFE